MTVARHVEEMLKGRCESRTGFLSQGVEVDACSAWKDNVVTVGISRLARKTRGNCEHPGKDLKKSSSRARQSVRALEASLYAR